MKIAIVGKRGVGKTTLAAALTRVYTQETQAVTAIDAGEFPALGQMLGIPGDLISQQIPLNKLNSHSERRNRRDSGELVNPLPYMTALPEECCIWHHGIHLLRWEPRSLDQANRPLLSETFNRTLNLVNQTCESDVLLVDLTSQIEQAAEALIAVIDCLLVVVDPGWRSLEFAHRLARLTASQNFNHVFIVGNKVHAEKDRELITQWGCALPVIGCLSFDPEISQSPPTSMIDCHGTAHLLTEVETIVNVLKKIHTR